MDRKVSIKRVYEEASPGDGYRILVDRLWPRGISKEAARVDEWLKDLAPSKELRKWFDHVPERFEEFRDRYLIELKTSEGELDRLRDLAAKKQLTLVYGARDTQHNQAVVLKGALLDK